MLPPTTSMTFAAGSICRFGCCVDVTEKNKLIKQGCRPLSLSLSLCALVDSEAVSHNNSVQSHPSTTKAQERKKKETRSSHSTVCSLSKTNRYENFWASVDGFKAARALTSMDFAAGCG